jgi:hypothetical protein
MNIKLIFICNILLLAIGSGTMSPVDYAVESRRSSWCPPDDDFARLVIDAFLHAPENGDLRHDLNYVGVAASEVVLATNSAICEMLLWDPRNQPEDGFFPVIYRHVASDRHIVVMVHELAGKPIETEEYIEFYSGPSVLVFFDASYSEEGRILL